MQQWQKGSDLPAMPVLLGLFCRVGQGFRHAFFNVHSAPCPIILGHMHEHFFVAFLGFKGEVRAWPPFAALIFFVG